jgi:CBS domain-containing protein
MELSTVKDLMVPLSGYATVHEEASLGQAVRELKKVQEKFLKDKSQYKHRAILIKDKNGKIVGKLSHLDVVRALEPKYLEFDHQQSLTRFGFSQRYLKTILKEFNLWDKALDDICEKAARLIVKDFMYTPTAGEFVREDASIEEAIHQLVMGRHQSLLVTEKGSRGKKIVGVLRLTDVFTEISKRICACTGE